MKIITTLSLLLIGFCTFAQNTSLTIFNNNGQQFFVIMNGIRQNSIPQTNVKIGGMSFGSYEVKLIFADGKTGDINKKIYIDAAGDYLTRVTFKKKKGKLQWFGMADGTQPAPAGGTNIQYRPNDQSTYSDQGYVNNGTGQYGNGQYGTNTQTQQNGAYPNQQTQNGQSDTQTQTNGVYSNGQTQTPGQVTQNGTGTTQTTTVTNPNGTNGHVGMNTNVVTTDPNATGQTGNGGMQTTTTTQTNQTGGTVTSGTTVNDPNNPNGQFGVNITINIQDPAMNGGTGGIGMTTTTTGNPNGQTGTMGTSTTISDPNMNGQGNINMNVSGMGNGTTTSSSSATTSSSSTTTQNGEVVNDSYNYQQTTSVTQNGQTTTTTQSSQYGNNGQNGTYQQNTTVNGTQPVGTVTTQTNGNTGIVPPAINNSCTAILTDGDGFVARLKAETFEDDKLEMIHNELKSQCVSADQAYNIVRTLTFDNDKLDISKYLYDRMTDKTNGKRLMTLLTFEMDKEELDNYMKTH